MDPSRPCLRGPDSPFMGLFAEPTLLSPGLLLSTGFLKVPYGEVSWYPAKKATRLCIRAS